jgi:hydrogenase maturation factor HypF (carbamoyltransferase family)
VDKRLWERILDDSSLREAFQQMKGFAMCTNCEQGMFVECPIMRLESPRIWCPGCYIVLKYEKHKHKAPGWKRDVPEFTKKVIEGKYCPQCPVYVKCMTLETL